MIPICRKSLEETDHSKSFDSRRVPNYGRYAPFVGDPPGIHSYTTKWNTSKNGMKNNGRRYVKKFGAASRQLERISRNSKKTNGF